MFDFVLSRGSLDEVAAKGDASYTPGRSTSSTTGSSVSQKYEGTAFAGTGDASAAQADAASLGYLSVKDKHLLRDALALECDGFLTMEEKPPRTRRISRPSLG
jgi:hypothetical protein